MSSSKSLLEVRDYMDFSDVEDCSENVRDLIVSAIFSILYHMTEL